MEDKNKKPIEDKKQVEEKVTPTEEAVQEEPKVETVTLEEYKAALEREEGYANTAVKKYKDITSKLSTDFNKTVEVVKGLTSIIKAASDSLEPDQIAKINSLLTEAEKVSSESKEILSSGQREIKDLAIAKKVNTLGGKKYSKEVREIVARKIAEDKDYWRTSYSSTKARHFNALVSGLLDEVSEEVKAKAPSGELERLKARLAELEGKKATPKEVEKPNEEPSKKPKGKYSEKITRYLHMSNPFDY